MPVGTIDEDGVGARDVEAIFNDGCGHEHIVFAMHKGQHDFLQLAFAHLAVTNGYAGCGYELMNL